MHHTFKEALQQEEGGSSRQVLDPVIWASLHGQLGASTYSLHQMQLKDYQLPSYLSKDIKCSCKYLKDDDNELINIKISCGKCNKCTSSATTPSNIEGNRGSRRLEA